MLAQILPAVYFLLRNFCVDLGVVMLIVLGPDQTFTMCIKNFQRLKWSGVFFCNLFICILRIYSNLIIEIAWLVLGPGYKVNWKNLFRHWKYN